MASDAEIDAHMSLKSTELKPVFVKASGISTHQRFAKVSGIALTPYQRRYKGGDGDVTLMRDHIMNNIPDFENCRYPSMNEMAKPYEPSDNEEDEKGWDDRGIAAPMKEVSATEVDVAGYYGKSSGEYVKRGLREYPLIVDIIRFRSHLQRY